jgi:histidine ammonia-lyase
MAPWAGHKLNAICGNVATILAIEWLAAAHAIDSQRPLRTSAALEQLHATLREQVPFQPRDHRLDREIATATRLVWDAPLGADLAATPA